MPLVWGNFVWDGFLAMAPRGRRGEKRFLKVKLLGALSGPSLPGRAPREVEGRKTGDRESLGVSVMCCAPTGWERGEGPGGRGFKGNKPELGLGRPGKDHLWIETGCQRKSKGPSGDSKSKSNSGEKPVAQKGERERRTFHGGTWGKNLMVSDPCFASLLTQSASVARLGRRTESWGAGPRAQHG
jgi:hypothetical protein